MKLGDIIRARDCGALAALASLPLADGKKRYKLRKALESFDAECKLGDKERERIVLEVAPEDRKVEPTHPKFRHVVDSIEAFFSAESDLAIEPVFDASNLDGISLTVAQERAIYALGLVTEENAKEPT